MTRNDSTTHVEDDYRRIAELAAFRADELLHTLADVASHLEHDTTARGRTLHARVREVIATAPRIRPLYVAAPEMYAALNGIITQFNAGYFVRNTDGDGRSDWAVNALEPVRILALAAAAVAKAEGR